MAFTSCLVVICLPIMHFFMFLGSALDVPLNMKILSFYPNFNKIPNHENSRNSGHFVSVALHYRQKTGYWSIFATLRTHVEVYYCVGKKLWKRSQKVARRLHEQDDENSCSKNTGYLLGWTTISFSRRPLTHTVATQGCWSHSLSLFPANIIPILLALVS